VRTAGQEAAVDLAEVPEDEWLHRAEMTRKRDRHDFKKEMKIDTFDF
jgi:hypothetical protein